MQTIHSASMRFPAFAVLLFAFTVPAVAGSLTYTYDDAGRLTQANGTPGARTYQLDPAGNRVGLNLSLQIGLGDSAPQSLVANADGATATDATATDATPPLVGITTYESGTP